MLTNEQVVQILNLASDHSIKRIDICKNFGISKSSFQDLINGKTHKNVFRQGCLRRSEYIKNLPELTSRQLEIINGSMLGDGSIKFGKKQNCSFRKSQSILNISYVEWHKIELSPYGRSIIKFSRCIPIHDAKRNIIGYKDKKTKHAEFTTINHYVFNELGKKWYAVVDGKHIKIIPADLMLTPLTIAVWYCDDGSNNQKHGRARFCTNGFEKKYVDFLSDKLYKEFFIENNIHKDNIGYIIEIRRRSYLDFIDLIRPFISFDCLKYKINTDLYVPPKFFKRPYHHTKEKNYG